MSGFPFLRPCRLRGSVSGITATVLAIDDETTEQLAKLHMGWNNEPTAWAQKLDPGTRIVQAATQVAIESGIFFDSEESFLRTFELLSVEPPDLSTAVAGALDALTAVDHAWENCIATGKVDVSYPEELPAFDELRAHLREWHRRLAGT